MAKVIGAQPGTVSVMGDSSPNGCGVVNEKAGGLGADTVVPTGIPGPLTVAPLIVAFVGVILELTTLMPPAICVCWPGAAAVGHTAGFTTVKLNGVLQPGTVTVTTVPVANACGTTILNWPAVPILVTGKTVLEPATVAVAPVNEAVAGVTPKTTAKPPKVVAIWRTKLTAVMGQPGLMIKAILAQHSLGWPLVALDDPRHPWVCGLLLGTSNAWPVTRLTPAGNANIAIAVTAPTVDVVTNSGADTGPKVLLATTDPPKGSAPTIVRLSVVPLLPIVALVTANGQKRGGQLTGVQCLA